MSFDSVKGKLIVFEGLDGSGKETQSKLFQEALRSVNIPYRLVSFPRYDNESSALIKMYLNGKFGKDADSVNAYAASSFYAVDRYASFVEDWKNDYYDGKTLIFDRYVTSNMVYQGAKVHPDYRIEFLKWLHDYEYEKLRLPLPDIVFYLKVHPEISLQNIEKRSKEKGISKDIHEKDASYMKRCHEVANFCADRYGWITIPCSEKHIDGSIHMRDIGEIHSQILESFE